MSLAVSCAVWRRLPRETWSATWPRSTADERLSVMFKENRSPLSPSTSPTDASKTSSSSQTQKSCLACRIYRRNEHALIFRAIVLVLVVVLVLARRFQCSKGPNHPAQTGSQAVAIAVASIFSGSSVIVLGLTCTQQQSRTTTRTRTI